MKPHMSGGEWWEASLGAALARCHAGDTRGARRIVDNIQANLADQLGPAGMESYERAYPLIVKLHMLQDLKQIGLQVGACQLVNATGISGSISAEISARSARKIS